MRVSNSLLFELSSLLHLATCFGGPHQPPPASVPPFASFTTIDGPVATGATTAQFTSTKFGLDGSKLDKINSSSFEWWYFDAVSEDQKSSICFIFFSSPETGFPFSEAPVTNINNVFLFVSTPANESLVDGPVQATRADVLSVGNGASGVWDGAGFSFFGAPDASYYSIAVDSPQANMSGLITFESVAPPHYSCGPASAGQDMQVFPHLGWSNAVPDAQATIDLLVDGAPVKFTGIGYHDMNWADRSFTSLIQSWYRGHARLGPYSIVWFDGLDSTGTEHASLYLSLGGKILATACTGVTVRPSGKGDEFPPKASNGPPSGQLHIEADLGHQGKFVVDVTPTEDLVDAEGVFFRFSGQVKGGFQGKKSYSGAGIYETFQLVP